MRSCDAPCTRRWGTRCHRRRAPAGDRVDSPEPDRSPTAAELEGVRQLLLTVDRAHPARIMGLCDSRTAIAVAGGGPSKDWWRC